MKKPKSTIAAGFAESAAEYRTTPRRPKRGSEYPKIPASEFAKNFGEYREQALSRPVAVTSHGRTTGYFISAEMFEEFLRIRRMSRRAYKVEDLPESTIRAMVKSKMDKKYNYLNKLLDD